MKNRIHWWFSLVIFVKLWLKEKHQVYDEKSLLFKINFNDVIYFLEYNLGEKYCGVLFCWLVIIVINMVLSII